MTIGISGPRQLTEQQHKEIRKQLLELAKTETDWLVGDAKGVDALAFGIAVNSQKKISYYEKNNNLPPRARGAERSTRMVKDLASAGGTLHAWPNKQAPEKLRPARSWPKNAQGSGTWGTIALAVGLGLTVVLHPLEEFEPPTWINQNETQLTLI